MPSTDGSGAATISDEDVEGLHGGYQQESERDADGKQLITYLVELPGSASPLERLVAAEETAEAAATEAMAAAAFSATLEDGLAELSDVDFPNFMPVEKGAFREPMNNDDEA